MPYSCALGDINNDKKIDSVDASGVLAEYARLSSGRNAQFGEKEKKAADVDKNSKIDSVDASQILAYYAYLSLLKEGAEVKTISDFISSL